MSRIYFKYYLPEEMLTKEMEMCDIEDEKKESEGEEEGELKTLPTI